MNWDSQLCSILSAADGSVTRMRERLTSAGKFSKGREDLFPVREIIHDSDLDPPTLPPTLPLPRDPFTQQPCSSHSPGVQWADLAAVQSQLQIQSQTIESLTKRLHDMDRDRLSQQHLIQTLQEEIHRLHEESKERERERGEERRGPSPGAERRMEQWRREVERELNSLRGQVSRATSLGNLEDSFSSKLRRDELESLRREVDQLKTQLRRHQEDVFLQQSEARETRRQYERSCKTLEELADSYRTHSLDMAKTVSQHTHTQQEVRQIRVIVSELKDEVRNLILKERQPTPLLALQTSGVAPVPILSSHRKGVRVQEAEPDSDSEDFSPTPSLAEVSSDDLSWLEEGHAAPHQKKVPGVRLSSQSRRSDLDDDEDNLDNYDDDDDDDDDHGDDLNLGSDLSLNDL